MDAAGSSRSPSRPLRIVICPWLAFGHMLPYLELAERLASRGHHVSFVSTPRNLARLPPRRHVIDLVALSLPRVEGLPDGAESTNDVPSDRRELLWEAFDALAAPFAEFLAAACAIDADNGNSKRPDWVLADTFHHWAPAAAREHGVPCAMLLPSAAVIAAFACGAQGHAELAADTTVGGGRPPGMPRYEWEGDAPLFAVLAASGLSIARRTSLTLERCTIAAIRSCPEWELDAFPLAAALLGKPLVPLGLLPPSPDGGRATDAHRDDAAVRWLDVQPDKSVVYVALGSEVPLRVELVHELAHGLELAGTRFLWALRKPRGVSDADVLPAGFLERTHGHGLVTMGWVPQIAILAHGAVGAFLTHCGRNSLIEGLLYGHPLIMLPIFGDQGPNARLMERRKVGLQVERNDDDGSFDRHGIASAVRAVMVEEDTKKVFVANAMKMQEIVADKELHERYVDEFVQELRSYITDGNSSTPADEM
ncbi:UDP-glycosyltransferase 91C1 [Setaria italica]|uniref:Glycosyltransferase n=1 Tax=Setaria italica TaxID=4555 RepID=K3ZMT1_SETIT|nr:UDP-glycosyltransferase 91C1 [Setaria italica]XP_012703804.1 UDP-glycosyltransferase 91C1 [Setaria italica]XP_012703805.1 UDP-glycosyltransferase 91C1 [Setaria italica]XP_012703806.1 UDP-glycosyltransferase 91C1 [Setaria italica]XP_012703807.1 UDP-glycosyltransferase 91C1 [Setaria italica]